MQASPYFAAIDLGSNSFHMLIGRINEGQLEVIDREKEMVQIARGLDEDGNLDADAKQRALDCLHRFSERLRDIPDEQVRAVGTKTLRSTKGSGDFMREAAEQLGHPIQIISGYEEARLVYCGLSHSITNDHNNRLVVDIGGGSTEFVLGVGYEPKLLESLSMGCVAYTNQFFTEKRSIAEAMNKAYMAACSELEEIRKPYTKRGWNIAYGTSGTIKAVSELVSTDGSSVIQYDALAKLMQSTMADGGVNDKSIAKLRRNVLPAGIAILKAIFDQLKIEQLHAAGASLKDGLIFDTVGRLSDQDSRELTVTKLMSRYDVDEEQSKRVAKTAVSLWKKIKSDAPTLGGVSRTKVLRWSANLHEIGLSISHSSYHNHGHYLLQHSDLAGFGNYEQFVLANLIRFHRKKIRSEQFSELNKEVQKAMRPLLLCIRLAARLNRRREDIDLKFELSSTNSGYLLEIDGHWLELNPLTRAGLMREVDQLSAIDIILTIAEKSK